MSLAEKAGEAAAVAALTETEHRTRLLAWTVSALRERRIGRTESSTLTRCVAEFAQLANVQLEYAKAVSAKRPVFTGSLPSLAGLLALVEQSLVDAALLECRRLRAEMAPILAEARRRLNEARR